jgi:hypothetical protein
MSPDKRRLARSTRGRRLAAGGVLPSVRRADLAEWGGAERGQRAARGKLETMSAEPHVAPDLCFRSRQFVVRFCTDGRM